MEQRKSYTATLLLSFFLGGFGIHRFYTGYIGLGILQLITFGGCGIWALIDFVRICFNNFKAADGQELADYNKTLGLTFFYVWLALAVIGTLINAASVSQILKG